MLNVVPITADPIGDRDCAAGTSFLFFAFVSWPLPILLSQVLRPDPGHPQSDLFSDR
jgi:hypothetical protein